MNFLKMLIGLPVIIIILIFAFVNNDLATFNFWPFYIEITVTQSVAIVILILLGFILGKIDSWMSYSPLRRELRYHKKENKKLNKEHVKLTEQVSSLQGDIVNLKEEAEEIKSQVPKPTLKERLARLFGKSEK